MKPNLDEKKERLQRPMTLDQYVRMLPFTKLQFELLKIDPQTASLNEQDPKLRKALNQTVITRKKVDSRVRAELLATLAKVCSTHKNIAYSRNGEYIATFDNDRGVALHDAKTFKFHGITPWSWFNGKRKTLPPELSVQFLRNIHHPSSKLTPVEQMASLVEKFKQGSTKSETIIQSYLLTKLAKIGATSSAKAACYSTDGKYLAVQGDYDLVIYDTETFSRQRRWDTYNNAALCFSPKDSNLLFGANRGIIDLATEKQEYYNGKAKMISWKPDGSSLFWTTGYATGNSEGPEVFTMSIPDLKCEVFAPSPRASNNYPYELKQYGEKQYIRGLHVGTSVTAIMQTLKGSSFPRNEGIWTTTVMDLSAGKIIGQIEVKEEIKGVVFSNDGTKVFIPHWNRENSVWDTTTCTKLFDVPGDSLQTTIFTADDTQLITARNIALGTGYWDGETSCLITFWDIQKGERLFSIDLPHSVDQLALNNPKQQLFVDGSIWDLQKIDDLEKSLSGLSDKQKKLLNLLTPAICDLDDYLEATSEQWKTFQSLPEKFEKALRLLIVKQGRSTTVTPNESTPITAYWDVKTPREIQKFLSIELIEWIQQHQTMMKMLSEISSDEEMLRGLEQAYLNNKPMHATSEQWKTFESLPEKFQEPLKKFIQRPKDVKELFLGALTQHNASAADDNN